MEAQEMFSALLEVLANAVTDKVMAKVNLRLEEFASNQPTTGGSADFTSEQEQKIKELAGEAVDAAIEDINLSDIDGFDYAVKQAVRDCEFTVDVR